MTIESKGYTPQVFNWLLNHVKDALIFTNEEGKILDLNPAADFWLGDPDVPRTSIYDFFDIDDLKEKKEIQFLSRMKTNEKQLFQVRMFKAEDQLVCILLHPVRFNESRNKIFHDLHSKQLNPIEGMVIHKNGIIVECDHSFAKMLGYTREELLDQTVFQLVDPKYQEDLRENMNRTGESSYQLKGRKKDGSPIYVEILSQPYQENDEILRMALIRDITELVEHEKQMEFIAYYDELTDLPNRNYFKKVLSEAISDSSSSNNKIAVHFMDVDYFKQINDTLGYQFGDELLKACAERLKFLLDEKTFIARMGDDEFLLMQRNIQSKNEAEEFATKVIQAFEEPIYVADYELYITVSIGISIYPENGKTPNDLMKHADSAMNVIKHNQRNHYQLFESSISENFKEMLKMETELRKAIREKQFEIHYQPQLDIQTEKLIGFEALLRWNHPEKGNVPPGVFIPLAEKTGLIIELGDWVLRETCRQNKKWQEQGFPPVKVSVNLSAKQFLQKNLVQRISEILEDTGLAPEYLELEITESMAVSNEEFIMDTLKGLRNLGVHVSIDDFGTGYSSLKYLSQFPVSKLKIDRLFISENKKQNQAIVKSIIHMSHSLDMKVIAEGVETKEQLDFLKNQMCDEIQGYYFSKPVHPNDADIWLNRTN
ncbi:MAG: EAL domain-containing protein [Bacillaceae bacterium]|nr:EAL domain-containing protein [Bacillaceae bacterium]